jgi:hypothetical protein
MKYTPSAGVNDGWYKTFALVSGSTYYFSFDFDGNNGIPYQAYFYNVTSASQVGTPATFTGRGSWNKDRVFLPYTAGSTGAFRVYFAKNNSVDTGPYWVDGCMLTAALGASGSTSGSALNYFDGDTLDCSWFGYPQGSASISKAFSYNVGLWQNMTDDMGTLVKGWAGTGMPPLKNIIIEYGLVDGAYYQRTKALERPIDFTIEFPGTSLSDLMRRRINLINAVDYSDTPSPTPFQMRFRGGSKLVGLSALYDAGLEGNYGDQQGFTEQDGMRVVAPLPYFIEEGVSAAPLVFQSTGSAANYIYRRNANGQWGPLGLGGSSGAVDGNVYGITQGNDGHIYVAGDFANMSSAGSTAGFARWNVYTQAWEAVGVGLAALLGSATPQAAALTKDAAGNIYIGGCTSTGGTGNAFVVKWDYSSLTIRSVKSGNNGDTIACLIFDNTGVLYAGGNFNHLNGTSGSAIAMSTTSGSTWQDMGAVPGMQHSPYPIVSGLAVDKTNKLWAVGNFDSAGNVANTKFVAVWASGSAWTSVSGSSGMAGTSIYACAVGPDGRVYVGGNATNINGQGINYLAGYNGSAWFPLSSGSTSVSYIWSLAFIGNQLYINGAFNVLNGITMYGYGAIWTNSTFISQDILLPGSAGLCSYLDNQGNYYVGWAGSGAANIAGLTAVNNAGTTITYPTLVFTGPGNIVQVRNVSTGDLLQFSLALLAGEVAKLVLDPINISFVSNFRGNILGTILPSSSFTSFRIMEGSNNLACYISGSGAGTSAAIQWQTRHLALDGAY